MKNKVVHRVQPFPTLDNCKGVYQMHIPITIYIHVYIKRLLAVYIQGLCLRHICHLIVHTNELQNDLLYFDNCFESRVSMSIVSDFFT